MTGFAASPQTAVLPMWWMRASGPRRPASAFCSCANMPAHSGLNGAISIVLLSNRSPKRLETASRRRVRWWPADSGRLLPAGRCASSAVATRCGHCMRQIRLFEAAIHSKLGTEVGKRRHLASLTKTSLCTWEVVEQSFVTGVRA